MKTVLVAVAAAISILASAPALAQGPSIAYFKDLPDWDRALFIAGHISGFAVAAQMPPERATALQRCFADWNNKEIVAIVDRYVIRSPADVADPRMTARIAIFSALAEACGWKRR